MSVSSFTLPFLLCFFLSFLFSVVLKDDGEEEGRGICSFIAVLLTEALFSQLVSSLQKFFSCIRDVVSLDVVQQKVSSSNEVATRLQTH